MHGSAEILEFLRLHRRHFEENYSVRRIGLFGSVLRGTVGDTSDVDILVEFSTPTFDNYMDLKFFLEEHIKMPVDLVLADSLKPRIKPIVLQETSYV
ncbi:MAG: nucleotidyltransferase family protein [Aminivibrio sp.]|jgi:predicted nucleotidyltransferase